MVLPSSPCIKTPSTLLKCEDLRKKIVEKTLQAFWIYVDNPLLTSAELEFPHSLRILSVRVGQGRVSVCDISISELNLDRNL